MPKRSASVCGGVATSAGCEPVCASAAAGLTLMASRRLPSSVSAKPSRKFKIFLAQRREFGPHRLLIPAGVLGNPVVADD
jgi:hypothetical protein